MAEQERRFSSNLFVIIKDAAVDGYNNIAYTLFSSILWVLVVAPLVIFTFLTIQVEAEMGENLLNIVFNLPLIAIIILYSALIIAPAAAARQWTDRLIAR